MPQALLQVLTTIFLANSVEYGELRNNRRDESVLFSMQTFVVKLASGIAILAASVCLQIFSLSNEEITEAQKVIDFSENVAMSSKIGLRMTMTIIPVIGLAFGIWWFWKRYKLNDQKMQEITEELAQRHAQENAQAEEA